MTKKLARVLLLMLFSAACASAQFITKEEDRHCRDACVVSQPDFMATFSSDVNFFDPEVRHYPDGTTKTTTVYAAAFEWPQFVYFDEKTQGRAFKWGMVSEVIRVVETTFGDGHALDTEGHISSDWLRNHVPGTLTSVDNAPFTDERIWPGAGAPTYAMAIADDCRGNKAISDVARYKTGCGEVSTEALANLKGGIGEGIGCDVLKGGGKQCRWRNDNAFWQSKFPYSYGAWLFKSKLDRDRSERTMLHRVRIIIVDAHTWLEVEQIITWNAVQNLTHYDTVAFWDRFANSVVIRQHK